MIGEVMMWDRQNNFGFVRTTTGKTFYMRGSSLCDARHVHAIVPGAKVEFERQPRDKSFDDALNAGLFRDDPRIVNHRNPRIVDKTKRPTAINVRLISHIYPATQEEK
jgi:cold shock CspA family protein